MKDLKTRLQECISIKQQLQQLGCLVDDNFEKMVSNKMNNFIKYCDGSMFKYSISETTQLEIVLVCNEKKKSGVKLVQS